MNILGLMTSLELVLIEYFQFDSCTGATPTKAHRLPNARDGWNMLKHPKTILAILSVKLSHMSPSQKVFFYTRWRDGTSHMGVPRHVVRFKTKPTVDS
jgi:hypothetical protein